MVCAPLRDLRTQCVMFLLQSVQAILLCLEFGRQLDQLMGRGLQGFAGLIVGRDGLFHVQVKVVLPGVGATEVAEQVFEPLFAGLLLFAQLADVALQRAQLFKVVGVLVFLAFDVADAFSLLGVFIVQLFGLRQTLGDALIQRHKVGRGVFLQGC